LQIRIALSTSPSHNCGGSPGISEGYGAAAHARWFHQKFDLIRVSPWAPSREDPLDGVQEFHVALNDKEMTRLVHSCDVLIAPNRRDQPQSLTTLEALASGLACVVRRHRSISRSARTTRSSLPPTMPSNLEKN
jgi:glycosyltransferase involved in cell wall biosynthesis